MEYRCYSKDKDKKEVSKKELEIYKCVLCSKFLQNPFQLPCGDRICKRCLPTRDILCICKTVIKLSEKDQIFSDISCRREMQDINVICDCGWRGTFETFQSHLDELHNSGERNAQAKSIGPIYDSNFEYKRTSTDGVDLQPSATSNSVRIRDVETLHSEQRIIKVKVNELYTTVSQLKEDVGKWRDMIEAMHQAVPQIQSSLDEVNLKLEILEVKSISGVYIWKVNEVQRRAREARSGKTVSLYSPPFYTSAHGYRLCLRAYLYGDGAGKGTHISVFLVIMQSEYDDILLWPFKHRVVISLINLDTPLKPETAITHKFVPNPQSNSFEKPKDTFNLASGFPQFASISVLTDPRFVKNDTMYFRVKLEAPDIKTSMDD